jgi:glucan-binding YG repeat protein
MKTGYLEAPDGHRYYFLPDGSMATGDVEIDGVMHHFNDTETGGADL